MMHWSAHTGTLYSDRPPSERFAAAVADGFTYVEMWSPFPAEEQFAQALKACGAQLTGFNLEAGNMAGGDRGILNDPSRRDEVLNWFDRAAKFAQLTGARSVNALVGNLIADHDTELSHIASLIKEASRVVSASGITILVETLNPVDAPRYLLNDVDETAGFIRELGIPDVKLLLDVYHVARGEADPIDTITRSADVIGHVHIADVPGRGAPGSGKLPLRDIVTALAKADYQGTLGLEYVPGQQSTSESLAWLPRSLRAAAVDASILQ